MNPRTQSCSRTAAMLAGIIAVFSGLSGTAAEALPEIPLPGESPAPPPEPVTPGVAGAFRFDENVVDLPHPGAPGARRARPAAAPNDADSELPPAPGFVAGAVRRVEQEAVAAAAFMRPRKSVLPDGRAVWTLAVRSPGAQALRLRLSGVELGAGRLVLYAPSGGQYVARGPYTGRGPLDRGDFWTPMLPGDVTFLEFIGEERPQFEVTEVGHIDALNLEEPPGEPIQGCHINARCQQDLPAVARDATGFMNFVDGEKIKFCTGTLLTDNDPDTVVPYFISAYHCISSQDVADTLEIVWLWQTPCGGLPPDFMLLPRSHGATLLEKSATKGGNDMAFFRLNGPVPRGVTMAGWTTAEPPKSTGAPRFASHHPSGAWARGGRFHRIDPFLVCKDLVEFYAFRCDDGVIEPGSSGSGIFNGSGQLQGQLYGRCCPSWLNGDENCEDAGCRNREDWNALYGRFDRSWGKVGKWLAGIGGTIHVDASAGPGGDGSKSDPFNTLAAAQALSWPGSRILMKAGSYPERIVLTKPTPVLAESASAIIGK